MVLALLLTPELLIVQVKLAVLTDVEERAEAVIRDITARVELA